MSLDELDHNNISPEVARQQELFPTESLKTDKTAEYIRKVWDIRESNAADEGALAFMAKCFIQATLPHSDPGDDVSLWHRENGAFSLEIQAARVFDRETRKEVNIGLPSGSIPRLLLAWMTTEAVRTKSPELLLGNSLSQFMDKLGLTRCGGKKGDITRLKNQAYKLFRSRFTLTNYKEQGVHEKDMNITSERFLFWNPQAPDQGSLWDSAIRLSPEFYDMIMFNPTPLDMRALHALKSSSMALDVYMWLSHRTFYLSKPQRLPWKALAAQMGAEYGRLRDFRKKVQNIIPKIRVFWPDLRVNFDDPEIITLYPSKPLITPKEMKRGKLISGI